MSDLAIKFENISKQYRLGKIGTGTISHDLNRWWARVRGKEDPFLKVTEMNDRSSKAGSGYVWALKDINLEVKQGEVLGIIGKNGAGKSTLLKILSRVTTPTTGEITAWGRIASLLEVGTGFHPEMTGRENIFMNGSIMGMTKSEIKSKFDEIVDFAGIEKYIDTPVKRYSSGMTVRLGFAIAAHLEPEILVVDEVLAVGDAEFQKKAIGKMQYVSSKEGRTVLFVSHNMSAINNLCPQCLFLNNGEFIQKGFTNDIIKLYTNFDNVNSNLWIFNGKKANIYFTEASSILDGRSLKIKCTIESNNNHRPCFIAINVKGLSGEIIMQAIPQAEPFIKPRSGKILIEVSIILPQLIPGDYLCDLWIGSHFNETYDYVKSLFGFSIATSPTLGRTIQHSVQFGYIVPESKITKYV